MQIAFTYIVRVPGGFLSRSAVEEAMSDAVGDVVEQFDGAVLEEIIEEQ